MRRVLTHRAILLAPLAIGIFTGAFVAWAQEPGGGKDGSKYEANPDAGLSDAEREANIRAFKERNEKWVADFSAKKLDPRTLPLVDIETYSRGATTPEEARAQADALVEGVVVRVNYVATRGDVTHSSAVVSVTRSEKGETSKEIVVRQVGGPAWNNKGGELQQLEGDPLLLPNQRVVLLLRRTDVEGEYYTVYGAGVYPVIGDTLHAPHSNAFADRVTGISVDAGLAFLK